MDSTSASPTQRPLGACLSCRKKKIKCLWNESKTCDGCAVRKIVCEKDPAVASARGRKRMLEAVEIVSNKHVIGPDATPSTSLTSLSRTADDFQTSPMRKKSRSESLSNLKSTQASQSQPPNQQRKSAASCSICENDRHLRNRVSPMDMVQCDIQTCGRWYHMVCLWYEQAPHMTISPGTGLKDKTLFICSNCVNQPGEYARDCITEGKAEATRTTKKMKRRLGSQEDVEPEVLDLVTGGSLGYGTEAFLGNGAEGLLGQGIEKPLWEYGGIPSFVPTSTEKYQGFDENLIRDLMRKIDQSIFDYNEEVCDIFKAHGDYNDTYFQHPLKEWSLVDPGASIICGNNWYHVDCAATNSINHASITSSLRSMVQTERHKSLQTEPSLHNLTLSQVHIAFASWFVIDVLDNRFEIFDLPNMKPLRAMRAGIHQFGEARWPTMGKHVMREVHLRTWDKELFRREVLQNKDSLLRRFELYMEPLAKRVNPWSHHRGDLIEFTIQLWSYLRPLEGKFEAIQPKLGSVFDAGLHNGFSEEGLEYIPEKGSKKTIVWVTRRGFRYREETIDGPRETLVKALVIVR